MIYLVVLVFRAKYPFSSSNLAAWLILISFTKSTSILLFFALKNLQNVTDDMGNIAATSAGKISSLKVLKI